MCLACAAVQVPVCSVTGGCGVIGLLSQYLFIYGTIITIALGTLDFWWYTVRARLKRVFMPWKTLSK